MHDRLLKPDEAAEYLGLGHSTLAKLRVSGGGPAFRKFGRSVRYLRIPGIAAMDSD
jgi:excisionase family DNA binding protein